MSPGPEGALRGGGHRVAQGGQVHALQLGQVAYTLRCLAELKGTDLGALCDTVTATAERTFGPW